VGGGDRHPVLREPDVVKQRLKLAAVSEKLLDIAEDGMTLEQLMAFTVTNAHAH
jgi:ParB family chromosome partitioning protein